MQHLPISITFPAQRSQLQRSARRVPEQSAPPSTLRARPQGRPRPPRPPRRTSKARSRARPRPRPPGRGPARSSPGPRLPPVPTPGRGPRPRPPDARPALRVVLVEVGEEQLAGAGLAALTRQVHGGRAAGGPGPGLARGRACRVRSGSAPGPARRLAGRSWLPGDQPPPHPVPALVYAPEPGHSARLRGPASSAHGLPTAQAYCGGPAPSPLAGAWGSGRTRARVGTRRPGLLADPGRRMRMEKTRCSVHSITLSILKGPAICQSC